MLCLSGFELYSRWVPQHNHNARDFPHFSSKITKNNCLEKSPFVKKKKASPSNVTPHSWLFDNQTFFIACLYCRIGNEEDGFKTDIRLSLLILSYYISPILNGWSFNSLTVDFRILITPGNVFPIWLEFQTVVASSLSDFIQMCGHYNVSVYQECCCVVAGYFLK